MEFGLHIPLEFFSPTEALACAREAERVGLDHVVVNDHLRLPWTVDVYEAWTVLAAIGAATEQIRVGLSVTPLPLRHPFLVAKMGATIDQLTGGRLLMGVGAGWHPLEFEWVGVPFHSHAERLEQTIEAIQLLRDFWTKSEVQFAGKYYQVEKVSLQPQTVQKPHPPFFFGGGSQTILRMVAQFGTGWMPFAPTPQGLQRRLDHLKELLRTKGRNFADLEIIPSVVFQLGKNPKQAFDMLPSYLRGMKGLDSRSLLGSPKECLNRIQAYVDVGATHLALRLANPNQGMKHIQVLAKDIIHNL